MYPFILFFLFTFFAITPNAHAAVNLHLSNSTITPLSDNTIRINNVTGDVDGQPVPGEYWIEFRWDPVKLMFAPLNAGTEPAGQTWSWTVNTTSFDSFTYTLTSDSKAGVFNASYSQSTGAPFICSNETFTQGNSIFRVSKMGGQDYAVIEYSNNFDGCGNIYSGQSISATISSVPSWFDFSKSFTVSFGGVSAVCEPDGTVHSP